MLELIWAMQANTDEIKQEPDTDCLKGSLVIGVKQEIGHLQQLQGP